MEAQKLPPTITKKELQIILSRKENKILHKKTLNKELDEVKNLIHFGRKWFNKRETTRIYLHFGLI